MSFPVYPQHPDERYVPYPTAAELVDGLDHARQMLDPEPSDSLDGPDEDAPDWTTAGVTPETITVTEVGPDRATVLERLDRLAARWFGATPHYLANVDATVAEVTYSGTALEPERIVWSATGTYTAGDPE